MQDKKKQEGLGQGLGLGGLGLGLGILIGLVLSVLFFLRNTPPPPLNKITWLEKIKPVSKNETDLKIEPHRV